LSTAHRLSRFASGQRHLNGGGVRFPALRARESHETPYGTRLGKVLASWGPPPRFATQERLGSGSACASGVVARRRAPRRRARDPPCVRASDLAGTQDPRARQPCEGYPGSGSAHPRFGYLPRRPPAHPRDDRTRRPVPRLLPLLIRVVGTGRRRWADGAGGFQSLHAVPGSPGQHPRQVPPGRCRRRQIRWHGLGDARLLSVDPPDAGSRSSFLIDCAAD